jgi:glycosyltransferase involved in cell wall biosynthesis
MGKLKIIIEERSDAIGICNRYLCEEIKKLDKNNRVEIVKFRKMPFLYLGDMYKFIRRVKGEDILLFTDPKCVKANLAFMLRNKKYIVVHHLDKEPLYYRFIPSLGIIDLIDCFDKVICDSEFTRKQLLDRGIAKEKTIVIYEGVDTKLFRPRQSGIGLPESYILSVGTELPRKNIKGVLEAMARLSDEFSNLKLVKIGRARSEDRKRTIEIIRELGLEDKVIFLGYVKDNDLSKYYSGAKMLLIPSFLEGFGLPILEAMACGCPVVTSDRGSMKELCGGTQILVDPEDSEDIAKKCRSLLKSDKKRKRLIKEGFRRVKDFGWHRTGRKVYSVLNSG